MATWVQRRGVAGMIGGGLLAFFSLLSFGLPQDAVGSPDTGEVALALLVLLGMLGSVGCLVWAVAGLYAGQPAGQRPTPLALALYMIIGILLVGVQGIIAIGLLGIGSRSQDSRLKPLLLSLGALGFVVTLPLGFWTMVLHMSQAVPQAGTLVYGLGWVGLGWMLWQQDRIFPQASAEI